MLSAASTTGRYPRTSAEKIAKKYRKIALLSLFWGGNTEKQQKNTEKQHY